jgi:hypothetical protein
VAPGYSDVALFSLAPLTGKPGTQGQGVGRERNRERERGREEGEKGTGWVGWGQVERTRK